MMLRLAALTWLALGCDKGAPPRPPAPPPTANPHALLLRLGRTVCYGTCPAYEIEVFRDGRVDYRGDDYVKTKGVAHGHVEPAQLTALDQLSSGSSISSRSPCSIRRRASEMPGRTVLA